MVYDLVHVLRIALTSPGSTSIWPAGTRGAATLVVANPRAESSKLRPDPSLPSRRMRVSTIEAQPCPHPGPCDNRLAGKLESAIVAGQYGGERPPLRGWEPPGRPIVALVRGLAAAGVQARREADIAVVASELVPAPGAVGEDVRRLIVFGRVVGHQVVGWCSGHVR